MEWAGRDTALEAELNSHTVQSFSFHLCNFFFFFCAPLMANQMSVAVRSMCSASGTVSLKDSHSVTHQTHQRLRHACDAGQRAGIPKQARAARASTYRITQNHIACIASHG